ncbi:hypothetical protein ACLB2K_072620 [Fragaria x ananassa]
MELESILGYLCNKTILITGATGLLGMVFVEKILRVQPDVKKLYLLVRPSHSKSATQRVNEEIIGKELFKILREKWGTDFDYFVSQKVVALSGDVSSENLGLNEVILEQVCSETQIIINSAANTNFDERGLWDGIDMKKKVRQIGIGALGSNLTENCKTDQGWLETCSRRVHQQKKAQYQGLLSSGKKKRHRRRRTLDNGGTSAL